MRNFKRDLEKKLIQSRYNNYGIDNYDEYRFGAFPEVIKPRQGVYFKTKIIIAKIIGYKRRRFLDSNLEFISKYEKGLQRIYEQISTEEKDLLVDIIAYRLIGNIKVKLPRNNKEYWEKIEIANSLADRDNTINPNFLHFILPKFNLRKIGYNLTLFFTSVGIAVDFIFEQYSYKLDNNYIVAVEKGDVVLDIGGCWGDTALYFASKTGELGKVYSFEFIPGNIKLFNLNVSLNSILINQIELIQCPVSNKSNETVYFKDEGPSSRIGFESFEGYTGITSTISIDDFVKRKDIAKVDFIKMDIEGAELLALEGAIQTIKKFKPKLAIAIYHNMEDFVNIPLWILGLKIGYKLFIGHYTIHTEETILFAKVEI